MKAMKQVTRIAHRRWEEGRGLPSGRGQVIREASERRRGIEATNGWRRAVCMDWMEMSSGQGGHGIEPLGY